MEQFIVSNASWLDQFGLWIGLLLFGIIFFIIIRQVRNRSSRRIFRIASLAVILIFIAGGTLLIEGPLKPFISSIAQVKHAMKSNINEFSFTLLDGTPMTVGELKGNAVILNFWGTYCAPCVRELPELQQIELEFKDRVRVVCLSDESVEKINAYVKKRPNHPSMMGTYDKKAWIDLDTFRPLTLLIDKNGRIIRFFTHELTFEELSKLL